MAPRITDHASGDAGVPHPASSVAASYARALLDFAVLQGAGREALLEATSLDASNLDDEDSRVPFERYVALMRAGQSLSGDRALGLHFGEAVGLAKFNIVGLIGQASESMLAAFAQLNRYVRLIVDVPCAEADRFVIRREESGVWIVDSRLHADLFPPLTESAFAQMLCNPPAENLPRMALETHVSHARPDYWAEYERVLGTATSFGKPRNAFRLNEAVLTHKAGLLPRFVFGVLIDRADALLSALDESRTLRGRVEARLLPTLHTGAANATTIAAGLGMSRQSLYRNLRKEGVTFEAVLDELRRKMALQYLEAGKASVHDIAYLVGYADPTSFSRAFRRWTGSTPAQVRQKPPRRTA